MEYTSKLPHIGLKILSTWRLEKGRKKERKKERVRKRAPKMLNHGKKANKIQFP